MKYYLLLFTTLLFCLFSAASSVHAHKISIFAWASGNTVYGESSFSGGHKAKNAEIQVLNRADNRLLLKTRTDEQGKFSFPLPREAVRNHLDLLLVVSPGEGHRGEWLLPTAEYLAPEPSATNQAPAAENNKMPQETLTTAPPSRAVAALPVDQAALRRIIDQELEKKLAPVKHMLARNSEQGGRLRDILGGIGYILGLAGMAAWARSGKAPRRDTTHEL